MSNDELSFKYGPYPVRAWIDQPSTLQSDHAWHGRRVLARPESGACTCWRAYPISGDTESFQVAREALSPGWPETSRP